MSDEYDLTHKDYYGGVFNSEDFWKETTARIYENYRFNEASISVLCGDGAEWITTGKDYVPKIKARFLDEFHLNKKVYRKIGRSKFIPKILDNIDKKQKDKEKENLKKAKKLGIKRKIKRK